MQPQQQFNHLFCRVQQQPATTTQLNQAAALYNQTPAYSPTAAAYVIFQQQPALTGIQTVGGYLQVIPQAPPGMTRAGNNPTYAANATVPYISNNAMNNQNQRNSPKPRKGCKIVNPNTNEEIRSDTETQHTAAAVLDRNKNQSNQRGRNLKNEIISQLAKEETSDPHFKCSDHNTFTGLTHSTNPLFDQHNKGKDNEMLNSEFDVNKLENNIQFTIDETEKYDIDFDIDHLRNEILQLEQEQTLCNRPIDMIYGHEFLSKMRSFVKQMKFECVCIQTLTELELHVSLVKPKQTISIKSTKFEAQETSNFKPVWQSQTQQPASHQKRFHHDKYAFVNGNSNNGSKFSTGRQSYCGRNSDGTKHSKMTSSFYNRTSFENYQKSPLPTDTSTVTTHKDNSSVANSLPVSKSEVSVTMDQPRKATWKPMRKALDGISEEEQKHEQLKKEIRGILNKITPSTYDSLTDDFCNYNVYDDAKLLKKIIDLIFEKAVEEPNFCPLYSDLCKKQAMKEREGKGGSFFVKALITKCQETFKETHALDQKIIELKKNKSTEGGLEENDQLKQEIELMHAKEKKRLLGVLKLIAQLFRHRILPLNVISYVTLELMKRGVYLSDDQTIVMDCRDETYIEYTVNFIEKIGEMYEKEVKKSSHTEAPKKKTMAEAISEKNKTEQKTKDSVEGVIEALHTSSVMEKVSLRVKFMILNLDELRANEWMPRGGDKGPKTIDEIHEEAQKEEEQNEAERYMYDKRKEEEREKAFQLQSRGFCHKDRSFNERRHPYAGRHSYQGGHCRQITRSPSNAAISQMDKPPSRLQTNLSKVDNIPTSNLKWGNKNANTGPKEMEAKACKKTENSEEPSSCQQPITILKREKHLVNTEQE